MQASSQTCYLKDDYSNNKSSHSTRCYLVCFFDQRIYLIVWLLNEVIFYFIFCTFFNKNIPILLHFICYFIAMNSFK